MFQYRELTVYSKIDNNQIPAQMLFKYSEGQIHDLWMHIRKEPLDGEHFS